MWTCTDRHEIYLTWRDNDRDRQIDNPTGRKPTALTPLGQWGKGERKQRPLAAFRIVTRGKKEEEKDRGKTEKENSSNKLLLYRTLVSYRKWKKEKRGRTGVFTLPVVSIIKNGSSP